MISAWHLLWIVPVAASIGYVACGVLSMNKIEQPDPSHISDQYR